MDGDGFRKFSLFFSFVYIISINNPRIFNLKINNAVIRFWRFDPNIQMVWNKSIYLFRDRLLFITRFINAFYIVLDLQNELVNVSNAPLNTYESASANVEGAQSLRNDYTFEKFIFSARWRVIFTRVWSFHQFKLHSWHFDALHSVLVRISKGLFVSKVCFLNIFFDNKLSRMKFLF